VDKRRVERVEVDGMELHVEPVDEDGQPPGGLHTALPPQVESWRRRSVTGAILTGFAFGLREVLEPERQEAAIVVQVSGEPVDDLPVEAHLDDRRPSESVVTVRPWLLTENDELADLVDNGSTGPTPEPPTDTPKPGDPPGP
jgi:hypothetical protein